MGGKRKFELGELAVDEERDQLVAIVDHQYRDKNYKDPMYRCIRIGPGAIPYSWPYWQHTYKLVRVSTDSRSVRTLRNYRANEKLGQAGRGCACQCCPHVRIEPKDIRNDGTLAWEDPL